MDNKNNVEFGTQNGTIGMSEEAKASSKAAAQKYRNNNQTGSNNANGYNYEFATGSPYQGMSPEAKASSQAAAQKYASKTQTVQNQQSGNYQTEFAASGIAQKGLNAMGQEAKQGTLAAQKQYKNEFGASQNSDAQLRSNEAAKQMRQKNQNNQGK